MRRTSITTAAFILAVATAASSSLAHYLWVTIDAKKSDHGTAVIAFEGGASPGDGRYLDPFVKRGKTWLRTLSGEGAQEIKIVDTKEGKKRWLSAELSEAGPRSVDSFGKWGVYTYGKLEVLLHYYARYLDVKTLDEAKQLGRARQMDLDIETFADGDAPAFRIVWKDKPVAGRDVDVRGPGGFRKKAKSDENGVVKFDAEKAGRYTLRTNVEELQRSGTFEDKDFDIARHHATLILNLPLK